MYKPLLGVDTVVGNKQMLLLTWTHIPEKRGSKPPLTQLMKGD